MDIVTKANVVNQAQNKDKASPSALFRNKFGAGGRTFKNKNLQQKSGKKFNLMDKKLR